MQEQSPSHPPPPLAATSAVLFVALELSGTSWLVAIQAPGGDKISRHKLAAGASAELLELVGRQRARAEHRTGRTVRVMSCYEAGRDGFWLHRLLVANGIENLVIDPASVAVNRRARRVKTDRIDAETLLRAMMARARGERRVCSVVRVPTPEAEDARRLTREREACSRSASGMSTGSRACARCRGSTTSSRCARAPPSAWTGSSPATGGRSRGSSRPRSAATWNGSSRCVHQIAEVEALRDEPASPLAKGVARLVALRGVGPNIASVLQAEILGRRFANRREVAQYAGLAPSPWASGGTQREQGIGKAGNCAGAGGHDRARLAVAAAPAGQCAEPLVPRAGRPSPRPGPPHRDRRGRRRLLVALWRYATDGVIPEGAVARG